MLEGFRCKEGGNAIANYIFLKNFPLLIRDIIIHWTYKLLNEILENCSKCYILENF